MVTVDEFESEKQTSANADTPRWLVWVDDAAERFGDAVNPILVKETRQALKSRQFLVTFSALLIAALGWTIAGSMSLMPQIYTTPSAPRMLIGYYVVLAIPLLLVVPLAAYRSLEGEIDDGTLELLSITSLSPWQIVLGKLASASLQMMLYFVALLPCVAYAYTLRGVDLPTTMLIIGILFVAAMILTIVALFFAPLAKSRTGRVATLLVCMGLLIGAQWLVGFLVIGLILEGNPLAPDVVGLVAAATVLVGFCIGHLLLTATAAQLTPESENRSTPLRLSLLMLTTVTIGIAGYGIQHEDFDVVMFSIMISSVTLTGLWTIASSMFVAESSVMTPRIRRELPSSFLSRMFLTWLTPGPATGLVFAASVAIILGALFLFGFHAITIKHAARGGMGRAMDMFSQFVLLYVSYLIAFLVCVRMIVAVARIKSNPRADIGVATMIVVLVATSLIPYAVGLQLNDYRDYDYSFLQITNWAWTLGEAAEGRLSRRHVMTVVGVAAGMFAVCLVTMPSVVLPRRIATPQRVKEEKERNDK